MGTFGKLSLNEDAIAFAELSNWVMTYVHDVYDDTKGRNIVSDLYRISKDPDKKGFLRATSLHNLFCCKEGDLKRAIENALKSVDDKV